MPRVLALIPARGGSKGLPRKNVLDVGGRPLIAWTIAAARAARCAPRIIVTTDTAEIAQVAAAWGAEVPFRRPAELATDEARAEPMVLHALDWLRDHEGWTPDHLLLLQPTSPLRTSADIDAAMELLQTSGADAVIGVATVRQHPAWMKQIGDDGRLRAFLPDTQSSRRQELPPVYVVNGAMYAIRTDAFRRSQSFYPEHTVAYVMPAERSVDIDTPADLRLMRTMIDAPSGAQADFAIGQHTIGPGRPAFVIAEAGVNHNGQPELAHRLVDVAADAGADAVKFQTFRADRLAAASAPRATYQQHNDPGTASQLEMLRRLEMDDALHEALAAHCRERGITFLSTPFEEASADYLESLDIAAFKIPSGELVNLPFLRHVAAKGRPIILSTGMATLEEVAAAVNAVRGAGSPPLALLHCVSCYPADPGDANLRAIGTLRDTFQVPVGFSDHTTGMETAIAAVALGASIVEKHFTVDRTLPGPDHAASLEPQELAAFVRALRTVSRALGTGVKAPVPAEADTARVARKSLVLLRDLTAGEPLDAPSFGALRPGTGISPAHAADVVGRRLRTNAPAGTVLTWEMLD